MSDTAATRPCPHCGVPVTLEQSHACGPYVTAATEDRLRAAYQDAKAQGSGPGLPRSELARAMKPSTYRPHPFIEFPLWGLEQALDDHKATCSRCSGNLSAVCQQSRYSDMLRDKIERLSRA